MVFSAAAAAAAGGGGGPIVGGYDILILIGPRIAHLKGL